MKLLSYLFLFSTLPLFVNAQVPIGQWQAHIPNNKGKSLIQAGDRIYCATETGVFYYNLKDQSVQKFGKIEGASNIESECVYYHEATKSVYIGYQNGEFDIIINGNTIKTVSDIYRKSYTSKKINRIQSIDDKIYISTDFGIVVYNPFKLEFIETYIIGENGYESKIYSITSDDEYIYAATEKGVKRAAKSSVQLPNYAEWELIRGYPNYTRSVNDLAVFDQKLIISQTNYWAYTYKLYVVDFATNSTFQLNPDSEIYTQRLKVINNQLMVVNKNHISFYSELNQPNEFIGSVPFSWGNVQLNASDAIFDSNGNLWTADQYWGLIKTHYNNQIPALVKPNAPDNNDAYFLVSRDEQTWIASGALESSGGNTYTPGAFSLLKNGIWKTFNKSNIDSLKDVIDIISIEANPYNQNQIYCCSWNSGVIEVNFDENSKVKSTIIYDENNSSLKVFYGDLVKVWDSKVDKNNNLWVINPGTSTPINVKKNNGDWKAFEAKEYNSSWGNFIIADDGAKWFLLPRGNGLYIFNEYNNLDDTQGHFHKHIFVLDQNNEIISNDVYAIAQDKNGYIWVGTNNGIVVYYNPQNVYNSNLEGFYASKIIIDINGKLEYLMESKRVTAIAVDGGNRKWIGTQQSGVFLLSDDGTEQILNFNIENSPLPSNQIKSISIDNSSGEVFIATGNGLMSYRGQATEGNDAFENVYAFPNPVKPDYTGPITIKGLMENTVVKITDVSGNIVNEMNSLGGQAIWDGNTLNGNRAKTGIYLVFLSTNDGISTEVTKILFIN
ncbi:MAG: hypothetical protein JXR60_00810 [Bacteroidales bacterium]|nr:hypothetical protein [Bacteroidales bacterium]